MKYVFFKSKRSVLYVFFTAILFLGTFIEVQPLFPEELNWFLETAVKNDYQLEILKNDLENTVLGIKKNNLDIPFSLTVSADNTGLTSSTAGGGSDVLLSMYSSPTVTLGLADPLETDITAGTDISIGIDSQNGTSSLKLYPSFTVNQPLNKILGLENSTESQDLTDKLAVTQGEILIKKREIECKTLVLNTLKNLYAAEKKLKEIDVSIMDAQKTFHDAVTLGSYSPKSLKYLQLKFSLSRLKRERITAERTLKNRRADLEAVIGSKFVSVPEILPYVTLKVPSVDNSEENPDISLANLRMEKDIETLKEQSVSDVPQLSTGLSMARTNSDIPDTDISGTFKSIFENFSFSVSVGGTIDSKSVYVKTGVSWSLPDSRIKNINKTISKNTIESDRLQVKLLEQSFRSRISAMKLELEDLENRGSNLTEEQEIAERNLKDVKNQFENGLISVEGVKKVQWQLDSLEYDKKALLLDKLITGQDIEELVLLQNSNTREELFK